MIDRCKFIHNLPCEQVSERITELEDENARLDQTRRSLHAEVEKLSGIIHRQRKQLSDVQDALERRNAENAKLRELLADTLIDPRDYCAKYGIDYDGWDSANDDIDRRLRELGVPHD